MIDATPPPEMPLDHATRAGLRERVMAGVDSAVIPAGRARSWRAPVAAAAAVLLVAGVTGAVAATRGGDDPSVGQPAASIAPTDDSTTSAPPALPPEQGSVVGPEECGSNLRYVLKGAEPVVAFELPSGSPAAFYVKGDRFTLCDVRADIVTVSQPVALNGRFVDSNAPLRVSMNFYDPDGDGRFDASFLAGGTVPEGAEEFFDALTYTFPDGHVADAELVTDEQGRTWWTVEYVATRGVIVAEGTNLTELDPIRVDLGLSGMAYTFDLVWLEDTCAQANHGC